MEHTINNRTHMAGNGTEHWSLQSTVTLALQQAVHSFQELRDMDIDDDDSGATADVALEYDDDTASTTSECSITDTDDAASVASYQTEDATASSSEVYDEIEVNDFPILVDEPRYEFKFVGTFKCLRYGESAWWYVHNGLGGSETNGPARMLHLYALIQTTCKYKGKAAQLNKLIFKS